MRGWQEVDSMATWFAQNSSVNINSINQWNSAANGSGSWLTWASLDPSDILVLNGKNFTVNVSFTCASITNSSVSGSSVNGTLTMAAGVTITSNLVGGSSVASNIVTRPAAGADSAVVGNVTGGSANGGAFCLTNNSTGTIIITGNVTAGSIAGADAARNTSSGSIIIIGNVSGGAGAFGVDNSGTGTVSITGTVTGGSNSASIAVRNNSSGTVNITGNVVGGSASVGASNTSTGRINITGNCVASSAAASVVSSSTGIVYVSGNFACDSSGRTPLGSSGIFLIHETSQVTQTYMSGNVGGLSAQRTLYTGGINVGHPSQSNVRLGTAFGASSEYTGTLAVPSPTLVAIGVATDNTVGSYAPAGGLDAAGVRTAIGLASANLDTQLSGINSKTTNLPSDPADQSLITASTDAISAALAAGVVLDSTATAALVDLIWDEPLTGATHNVATSSGKRLRQTTAFQQIDSTVIDAAATTTTFITGLTSSVDDFYNDSMLVFTDGALAGQVRAIYDYIGATKTIILEEALTSAPVNGVAFAIVSLHIHPVSQIQSGLATAAALATESTKLNRIEAVATGTVTGAGTSTEVFVGPSATLTITVDSSGNRSAVVVT